MNKYIIEVYNDINELIERLTLSKQEEAEQVAEVLENLTAYQIICSWKKDEDE